jgi:hypothetical protein
MVLQLSSDVNTPATSCAQGLMLYIAQCSCPHRRQTSIMLGVSCQALLDQAGASTQQTQTSPGPVDEAAG